MWKIEREEKSSVRVKRQKEQLEGGIMDMEGVVDAGEDVTVQAACIGRL